MIYDWERVTNAGKKDYQSLDDLYADFPTGTMVRWADRITGAEGLGRVSGVCRGLPINPGEDRPPTLIVAVEPHFTTGHVYPAEITAKCKPRRSPNSA